MHQRIDPYNDSHIMKLSRLAHIKRYQKATSYSKPTDTILDIGCGTGYGSVILAQKAQLVHAIDNDHLAIDYARTHYQQNNIEYAVQDIQNIDTQTQYDIITCFEVLEHTQDPNQTITLCNKQLKQGGKLILSVPNGSNAAQNNEHHQHNFTQQTLQALLQDNGLHILQSYQQYAPLGMLAERRRYMTNRSTNTNTAESQLAKYINYIPLFAELFSNIYKTTYTQNTGRTIYIVARKSKDNITNTHNVKKSCNT